MAALSRRLAAMKREIRKTVAPAVEASAHEMADMAEFLAPVKSGDLRDSIVVTTGGQTTPAYSQPGGSEVVPENAAMVTVGNAGVRYSHLIEYGTREKRAQPFFWPAYRLVRPRVIGRIRRAVAKAVRETFK